MDKFDTNALLRYWLLCTGRFDPISWLGGLKLMGLWKVGCGRIGQRAGAGE